MEPSAYTISVTDWMNDSSLEPGSREKRRSLIRKLERSNCQTIHSILTDIRTERTTPYAVCRKFIDDYRSNHASGTVYVARSQLPGLFASVLGEENFSMTAFNRLVPSASCYVTHFKKIPTREFVSMLRIAYPRFRALLGFLGCTGWRISEVLTRRMTDLEVRPAGYARVRLQAADTKAKYRRFGSLTKECLD